MNWLLKLSAVLTFIHCFAIDARAQETLSVVSTNNGNGSFGWVFSAPLGFPWLTGFRMQLPGVQETFPPLGWIANVGQDDVVIWEFVGPNGDLFTGAPMAFAVHSTISDTASYDGLAWGFSTAILFSFAGPRTPASEGVPSLSITLTTTNTAVIWWASPSTGWNLQQNTNLTTTIWSNPAEAINDDGTKRFIIVNPTVGNRFYRLFKP